MKKLTKILTLALIIVMSLTVLVACGPAADPEKAVEALKKNGYEAEEMKEMAALMGIATEGLETMVMGASKEDMNDAIMILYFETAEAAEKAWEDLEEYVKEAEEQAKEEDTSFVAKQSGKMIWIGSKAAIKAAR